MKKLALAVTLAVTSFASVAEDGKNYIKLEGTHYNVFGTENDKNGVNLTIGREVTPGIKLDLKQEFRDTSNTQSISNRFETGATVEDKILGLKVGARGAIGEKFTNGDNYGYWLVEPFVSYDVTKDLSVKGSWRYRNAFDSDKHDQNNTYKISAAYNLSKEWTVDGSVGKSTGNTEYTQVGGGLTYKF